ncbi:MAG: hypothetical protein DNFNHJIP_00511 [Candidatus Argoarchaeum ethanivorans]|uniref:Uncharacterized protein n=1 Tax=Candidatus Argoarchaeum ethanivorans TaxID=2608793 RepID=A0A812A1R7_9EURY|nr:MAG: hypothetical protein DNFNHJIP_00511 [Candidatus Argoarchaeum ethanivorans]
MDKKDGYIHLLDPHTGIWNKYKKTKSNRNQLFSKRFKSKEERRFKPTKRPKYKKGQKIYKRSFNWSPGGA